jgi:DNA-binding NtrC family response regulator
MSDAKRGGPVLVIGTDPGRRAALERALADEWRSVACPPEGLRDRARLLDCAAGLVAIEARDFEAVLDRVAAVSDLPCAARLALIACGLDDAALSRAIQRLAPAYVLVDPVPPLVLRHAVARMLPLAVGQGSRAQHRAAPAMLGVSRAIRDLLEQVRQVAGSNAPVLICGETGTGKELVARSLHEQSPRAAAPFIAVNCGALPDSLLESELFGHARGAFTGADRAKSGLLENANGGTLFLDEVGEMSPALQIKLLRFLESHEIRPLGATESRLVDVRIVSATNRDLEAAVHDGAFRQDLLYRLNAVTLYVPPLRRRRVDIPFLAQHFAEELGEAHARRVTLDEQFLSALARHDFPGNVRELRNALERAIALAAPGEEIGPRHLPPQLGEAVAEPAPSGTLRERLERVEIEALREALQRCGGNRTHAAEALGLSRLGLRQKLRRHGIG